MSVTRVLGIDTSLRGTGLGVVEGRGNALSAVTLNTLHCPSAWPHSRCLARIDEGITDMIAETKPDAVAIEGIFHCRNVKTAIILGQARGAAIAACARQGLPVFEYSPRRVKQAACGTGAASKEQMIRMVTSMLRLAVDPKSDEADALALAVCHLNSRTTVAALSAEPI